MKKRLHALDEDFTERRARGLGGYNFDKECSEVWLYDESVSVSFSVSSFGIGIAIGIGS